MMTKQSGTQAAAVPYKKYVERMDALIRDTLHKFDCRPVFFVGSGLSRRYISTPGWAELLQMVANQVDGNSDFYNYLFQKHEGKMIAVGTELSEHVFEWAWKTGRNHFPKEYFAGKNEKTFS